VVEPVRLRSAVARAPQIELISAIVSRA